MLELVAEWVATEMTSGVKCGGAGLFSLFLRRVRFVLLLRRIQLKAVWPVWQEAEEQWRRQQTALG